MINIRQSIVGLICIYLCSVSCSRGNFDIKNDKTRSLISNGIDSIGSAYYFPDRDVRKYLHENFNHFYKNREYNLAWLTFDKPKQQVYEFLETLYAAPSHGLETENYNIEQIEALLFHLYNSALIKERSEKWRQNFKSREDKRKLREEDTLRFTTIARLDFLLTASYLTYAWHLFSGMINPNNQPALFEEKRKKGMAQYLENALDQGKIKESLEKLAPSHEQYALLKDYLKYFRQTIKNFKSLPLKTTLGPGDWGDEVLNAKKKLILWKGIDPAMDDSLTFDAAMETAVKKFQKIHGLDTTGRITNQVRTLLNLPPTHWISKIETNMERLRWIQHDFGKEYILVNIPAYSLKVIENGNVKDHMKVIVGTDYKKTPVFSDTLEYVVFNPTWTVPDPIAIEEMLPELKEDDDYLTERNLKLYDGWSTTAKLIDPEDVDWDDVDSTNWHYRIVEAPGPENSLGRIKFMMPNNQSIYLHDTPADHLFSAEERSFSHGCIRVQKPLKLAAYLLNWDVNRVQEYINSEEIREVAVDKKIPVHIVYWSAWVDENGMINFRDDVYNHDRRQRRQIERKEKIL